MRLVVCADAEEMSRRAAERIVDQLRATPSLLLCAATGSTPTRTYALLAEALDSGSRRKDDGRLPGEGRGPGSPPPTPTDVPGSSVARADPHLFSRLRVLKLDEWYGLEMGAPGSCESYLRRHLLGPLGVADDRYQGFRSTAPDPAAEAERIDAWLAARGPIDLCLLGLGLNGHLGFNEPGEALPPYAHLATLSEQTRRHPMIGEAGARPSRGLTLGLAQILGSRRILLLVSGGEKRDVLSRLLSSHVTTRLPASFLHLHGDVTVLCDREAAGEAGQR